MVDTQQMGEQLAIEITKDKITSKHVLDKITPERIQEYLKKGGNPNYVSEKAGNGYTLANLLAARGYDAALQELLKDPRTDAKYVNKHGATILHDLAAAPVKNETMREATFDLLAQKGADFNAVNDRIGTTPIGYAVDTGLVFNFAQLIRHGADPTMDGGLPVEARAKRGREEFFNSPSAKKENPYGAKAQDYDEIIQETTKWKLRHSVSLYHDPAHKPAENPSQGGIQVPATPTDAVVRETGRDTNGVA